MAFDPEMGGDTAPILAAFQGAFAGHVRMDAVIVESCWPGALPWLPRATAIMLLDPTEPRCRCGIVDLWHPSESKAPRCGDPDCRCMHAPYLSAASRPERGGGE